MGHSQSQARKGARYVSQIPCKTPNITVCDAELGSNSITDEGATYRLYV